jgi:hypothetical protein
MSDPTGQGELFRTVCLWDEAIVWEGEGLDREAHAKSFRDDRDLTKVKFAEGKRPCVFTLRRLRRTEMRDVSTMQSDAYQAEAGFSIGVTQVEMPDGSVHRPVGSRWTEKELDAFDNATVTDIGTVVVQRSRLPLGLRVSYVAPHSSVVALAARLFHGAGQSRTDAGQSKSPPAEPLGT